MLNIYKYSDEVFDIFCKTYYPHLDELTREINEKRISFKDIDAENYYSELCLSENQRKVIDRYVNTIKIQADKAIMIAYVKAIEHTLEYINKNTPEK